MNKFKFLSLSLVSLLLFQCGEQEYPVQEQLKKDKKIIENYAKENNLSGSYIYNDIYKVTTVPSEGNTPQRNYGVRVKGLLSLLDGTVIDSSTAFYQHDQRFYIPGWEAAVSSLKNKEEATFLIPSYYGFGSTASTTKDNVSIPGNSVLKFDAKLLDIVPTQAVAHAYAHFKGLTGTVDSTGIFYTITQQGSGATPVEDQKVTVKYKGYLLNDFVFDESDSFTFTLGASNIIQGWNRVASLLKVGDKATVVIPSSLAYKDQPVMEDGKVIIPANATIAFDMEILKVE